MTDSDDGLENWQNRLYELHGHRCARITKSLRWLGSQTRPLAVFDGSTDPEDFIEKFSSQIPNSQKMETLDSTFRATAARWWNGHKQYIHSWEVFQQSLRLRVTDRPREVRSKFNGKTNP